MGEPKTQEYEPIKLPWDYSVYKYFSIFLLIFCFGTIIINFPRFSLDLFSLPFSFMFLFLVISQSITIYYTTTKLQVGIIPPIAKWFLSYYLKEGVTSNKIHQILVVFLISGFWITGLSLSFYFLRETIGFFLLNIISLIIMLGGIVVFGLSEYYRIEKERKEENNK
ncbi:MAG: hypothetical protein ACTSUV_00330 [Candidatus Ranarchaeia archaeon]